MYVLFGYPVSTLVVPHGKHTAQYAGSAFGKCLFPVHYPRRPFLINPLVIEEIPVVTCCRNDIEISVTSVNQLVPVLQGNNRIHPVIRPRVDRDTFRFYGSLAGKPFQSAPHTYIFAVFLNKFQITVCEVAVLFGFFLVVFVGTDVQVSDKYGIVARQIFVQQAVDELISFFFVKVQMIHAILPTCYFGFVVGEGE